MSAAGAPSAAQYSHDPYGSTSGSCASPATVPAGGSRGSGSGWAPTPSASAAAQGASDASGSPRSAVHSPQRDPPEGTGQGALPVSPGVPGGAGFSGPEGPPQRGVDAAPNSPQRPSSPAYRHDPYAEAPACTAAAAPAAAQRHSGQYCPLPAEDEPLVRSVLPVDSSMSLPGSTVQLPLQPQHSVDARAVIWQQPAHSCAAANSTSPGVAESHTGSRGMSSGPTTGSGAAATTTTNSGCSDLLRMTVNSTHSEPPLLGSAQDSPTQGSPLATEQSGVVPPACLAQIAAAEGPFQTESSGSSWFGLGTSNPNPELLKFRQLMMQSAEVGGTTDSMRSCGPPMLVTSSCNFDGMSTTGSGSLHFGGASQRDGSPRAAQPVSPPQGPSGQFGRASPCDSDGPPASAPAPAAAESTPPYTEVVLTRRGHEKLGLSWGNSRGLVLHGCRAGTPAANSGAACCVGMVLTHVNGQTVATARDLTAKAGNAERLTLRFAPTDYSATVAQQQPLTLPRVLTPRGAGPVSTAAPLVPILRQGSNRGPSMQQQPVAAAAPMPVGPPSGSLPTPPSSLQPHPALPCSTGVLRALPLPLATAATLVAVPAAVISAPPAPPAPAAAMAAAPSTAAAVKDADKPRVPPAPPPPAELADQVPASMMSTELTLQHKSGRRSYAGTSLPGPVARQLLVGTYAIVEAAKGVDLGLVVSATTRDGPPGGMKQLQYRYVRPATFPEVSQWSGVMCDADRAAAAWAKANVEALGVPVQIRCADYQFDRLKLTFHYTSSKSKPDFRQLLHNAFREFRTRIWMNNCSPTHGQPGDALDFRQPAVPTAGRFLAPETWHAAMQQHLPAATAGLAPQ
eukprot:TRINITY_DN8843_c4_g1_i1.p1 TRINITY_DN8843_c4_g1~~TRINITY_DN8843_c4_g1_i1.p1  ORF type:complete len:851 (+),score=173.62 TRINITY_DN8843_c4_g1_i1:84-2636(+)